MGLFFGYMDICFVGVCKFEVKLYLRWWSFLIYSFKSQCHSSVVLCQHCLMITAGWNEVFIKLRSKAFWEYKSISEYKGYLYTVILHHKCTSIQHEIHNGEVWKLATRCNNFDRKQWKYEMHPTTLRSSIHLW